MNRQETAGRYRIRPARDTDLPAMGDLLDGMADAAPDRAKLRRGLTALLQLAPERGAVLVAEERGQLIGVATCQTLISTTEGGAVGQVEEVVIRDDRRMRGIGRSLLEALETWAKQQGLKRLQLLADDGHQGARSFCERLGWQPAGLVVRRKDFV